MELESDSCTTGDQFSSFGDCPWTGLTSAATSPSLSLLDSGKHVYMFEDMQEGPLQSSLTPSQEPLISPSICLNATFRSRHGCPPLAFFVSFSQTP